MVRSDRAAVGHAVGDGGGGARDGGEWIRQFDEDSQHFYMFNQSTGGSLWEDDAADGVDAGQVSIEMVETGSTSKTEDVRCSWNQCIRNLLVARLAVRNTARHPSRWLAAVKVWEEVLPVLPGM